MLQIILSWRFLIGALSCIVITVLMLYINNGIYREKITSYEAIQREQEERLNKAFSLQWPEYFIYKKPPALSVLCTGIVQEGPYEGLTYGSVSTENPLEDLFLKADLAWIIGIVLSLIALVFSHDAISGERENGTLRLMLSNPTPRHILILGKWCAGLSAVTLILFLTMLVALLSLLINKMVHLSSDDILAVVIMTFTSILYLSAIYLTGMVISIVSSKSAGSMLLLLGIWCLGNLLLPAAIPQLAHIILKTQPENVYKEKILTNESAYMDAWQKVAEKIRTSGTENQMLWALAAKDGPFRKAITGSMRERALINSDMNARIRKETNLSIGLSLISPYASFKCLMNDLSNTGTKDQEEFSRAAQTYTQRLLTWLEGKFDNFYKLGKLEDIEKPLDTKDMPEFHYSEPAISARILSITSFALVIILYNFLCFILAELLFVSSNLFERGLIT
jgi:ABC-type transport system involved in multi-copper enzyme maturation permease subunit